MTSFAGRLRVITAHFVRVLTAWPVAIVLAAVVYGVALEYKWLASVDFSVYDMGLQMRSPSPGDGDVVIVAIDRNTLENSFQGSPFPISRHLAQHSEVVRRLDSAGAALVVLDILFDQLDTSDSVPLTDFVSTVAKSKKVILATSIESHQIQSGTGDRIIDEKRLALPVSCLGAAALDIGLVNVPVDPDGIIRRSYYAKQFQNQLLPSLAQTAKSWFADKHSPSVSTAGSFQIDYNLLFKVERVSYERALMDDNWQQAVQNKIVIIGLTENGSIDNYQTPLGRFGRTEYARMSGVEIQSAAVQTLLSGDDFVTLDTFHALLVGLLFLTLFGYVTNKVSAGLSIIVVSASLFLIIVCGLILVARFSVIIPIGALVVSIITVQLLILTLNSALLQRVTQRMQRQLKGIQVDLDEARPIQQNLQPATLPTSDRFEIARRQITCREVGGDYYDILDLGNDKIGLLVADVAGHGVASALIMSNVQATFRQLALRKSSPAEILKELNATVIIAGRSQYRFITLFYGILDISNLTLEYSNAGHCFPIVCSNRAEVTLIQNSGVPLGLFDKADLKTYHVSLNHGDVLCLYTDGVTEASGDDPTRQFGEQRLISCVQEKHQESAEVIQRHIYESCQRFVQHEPFADDWTLVVVKLR